MPLTTYVAGDVLTASSLNDNLTFAAANPPASAAGLAFINSTAFTTATSVSLPADTFTSTFDNYRMQFQLTALTAPALFTIRLRAAGSDNTTGNYNTFFIGLTQAGTATNQTNTGGSSFLFGENSGTNFQDNYSLWLDVKNPQLSNATIVLGQYNFVESGQSFRGFRNGGGIFLAATSFDSLSFISSVASSMTGVVKIYGYQN